MASFAPRRTGATSACLATMPPAVKIGAGPYAACFYRPPRRQGRGRHRFTGEGRITMHDFTMPQWAIDRVMQRRGELHVHANMDPRRTALIVVDLQNGFMVPEHTQTPVK